MIRIDVRSSGKGIPVMARGAWYDEPLPWWHWLTARDSWRQAMARHAPKDGVAIIIRREQ